MAGELFKAAGTCSPDDSDISDVVAHHGIEFDAHLVSFGAINVVAAEDLVSDGVFRVLLPESEGSAAPFSTSLPSFR